MGGQVLVSLCHIGRKRWARKYVIDVYCTVSVFPEDSKNPEFVFHVHPGGTMEIHLQWVRMKLKSIDELYGVCILYVHFLLTPLFTYFICVYVHECMPTCVCQCLCPCVNFETRRGC